jgi:predicted alpha/beta-fold hydrolase
MGGFVALHAAHQNKNPRLKAVASICSPLDLRAAQLHIDTPRAAFYRHRVLNGLIESYRQAAKRHAVPTAPSIVRKIKTFEDWDRLTIVPRYGFDSPEHYYRSLSLERKHSGLAVPAILGAWLLVPAEGDPVISTNTIRPFLPKSAAQQGAHALRVHWVKRAGHLAFPSDLNLNYGPDLGLEAQLLYCFQNNPASADQ